MAVGEAVRGWRAMPLEMAVRVVYWSLIITGVVSAVMITIIPRFTGPDAQLASHFGSVVSWSVLAAVTGGVLLGAVRVGRLSNWSKSPINEPGLTAFVLSIAVGIMLLLVPALLLVLRIDADDTWWSYPLLNKRWLGALYWIALGSLVLLPPVLRRLHVSPLEEPQPTLLQPVGAAWGRWLGAAALVAVAWLVAGPPWHVAAHHRPIDFHEQVHLGPLQAIDKGYVPFVGPASTQYGPGTQLLTYWYMKWTGQFDIVGFREANLVQHFGTTVAVSLLAWWTIGFPGALAVLILGISFSPLQFFTPAGDGTFQGFYGWGNGLRYLGALVVVPLTVQRTIRLRTLRLDWPLLVLGATAGGFAWLAQENLGSTVAALAFVLVLLIATHSITWRTAVSAMAQVAAGAAGMAIPVVLYYLLHGELTRFLHNYMLVPRAVVMGFQNTWWAEGSANGQYRAYCFTTAVIVIIGSAAVWNLREMRLRHPLTDSQARLLAYLGVLAASYHTALYRADSSHLMNTLLALPFVLVLVFRDLPEWTVQTLPAKVVLRAAIVAATLWVYPISLVSSGVFSWVIQPSVLRFQQSAPARVSSSDPRPAFVRATEHLQDEPILAAGAGSMRQFLEDVSVLKATVGERRTYIVHVWHVFTGLVYFMGDLTPAPYLFDREMMVINASLSAEALSYMRQRLDEFDCVISSTLEAAEVTLFLGAHPDARTETLTIAGAPVYVVMKR